MKDLVAQPEVRGQTTGQVGTDASPRRTGSEYRSMLDIISRVSPGCMERVVRLWQPPEIVVAPQASIAVANANLIVERPGVVVPHFEEPADLVPAFGHEVVGAATHERREVPVGNED